MPRRNGLRQWRIEAHLAVQSLAGSDPGHEVPFDRQVVEDSVVVVPGDVMNLVCVDLADQLVQESAETHRAASTGSLRDALDGHRPIADLEIEDVPEKDDATDRPVLASDREEFFEVAGAMK